MLDSDGKKEGQSTTSQETTLEGEEETEDG